MNPTVDNRAARGDKAGLHAFIVGVSEYPYLPPAGTPVEQQKWPDFGMRRLTAGASSAFAVFEWLVANQDLLHVKLATCRLLLAPTPAEAARLVMPPGAGAYGPADHATFGRAANAWRDDASTRNGNVTFFYFAGHGVQRGEEHHYDQVLLLSGFGDPDTPILKEGVELDELTRGMTISAERMKVARNQLYFIDACRSTPDGFAEFNLIKADSFFRTVPKSVVDSRNCILFYATVPGSAAYSGPAQTYFSGALLQALKGGAGVDDKWKDANGDPLWCVTANSLIEALNYYKEEIYTRTGISLSFQTSGLGPTLIIAHLKDPPQVDIVVEIVAPPPFAGIKLSVSADETEVKVFEQPLEPHPRPETLPAGLYQIAATVHPPQGVPTHRDLRKSLAAKPPGTKWYLKLPTAPTPSPPS